MVSRILQNQEYTGPGGAEDENNRPTKQEFQIAKWLKKNVPTKKTKFLNHNVEYFTSSKALDALMASKFAQGENCQFPDREQAIEYMDTMLIHKFFHRAKKVPVSEAELRRSKKAPTTTAAADKESSSSQKEKEKEKPTIPDHKEEKTDDGTGLRKRTKDEKITDDNESSHVEGGGPNSPKAEKEKGNGAGDKEVKEKKKRKIRLDMHPDQVFVDGAEAYVWIYDPIPMHYWLFGALVVVGAIVLCMFPLWPPSLRKGVYYLSVAAAGFLVFILGLTILRGIVFSIVWVLTGSRHHLWLFPNLTEDVGFFASFWPLYKHDYNDPSAVTNGTKEKKKRRKKDKDSDAEDDTVATVDAGAALITKTGSKVEDVKETLADVPVTQTTTPTITTETKSVETTEDETETKLDKDDENKQSNTPSESESETSQRSSTGKDFEIVDTDDVEAC